MGSTSVCRGSSRRLQEAKKKQAEEAANVKLDKVLTAFRLVKNNKFAELEDMLVEGVDGFKSC